MRPSAASIALAALGLLAGCTTDVVDFPLAVTANDGSAGDSLKWECKTEDDGKGKRSTTCVDPSSNGDATRTTSETLGCKFMSGDSKTDGCKICWWSEHPKELCKICFDQGVITEDTCHSGGGDTGEHDGGA